MRYLLLLFISVPIVEMWLLIAVGQQIGAPLTISLVVATAVIGVYWLRQQGFSTLTRLNQRLASGQLPAREIAEGVVLTVGGALLLTPGFATDILGFSCLFTPTRALWANSLLLRIQAGAMAGFKTSFSNSSFQSNRPEDSSQDNSAFQDKSALQRGASQSSNDIIDGEYSRDD